jgi:hypothetical protein
VNQDSDSPSIHVVKVGGTTLKELINLVVNDVIPERAVITVDTETGDPIVVWVGAT